MNYEQVKDFYQKQTLNLIKNWNEQAENFKNVVRKSEEKYQNWWFVKWRIRKILIQGSIYFYKLGVYKNKKNGKKFTYYHNEILAKNKRLKYFIIDIYDAFYKKNYARRGSKIRDFIPSDIVKYHCNSYKFKVINSFKNKGFDYKNLIKINVDDTYIIENKGAKKIKKCLRLVIINNEKQQKSLMIFDVKKFNTQEMINKIKGLFAENYDQNNTFLCADGAQVFNQFAINLGAHRVYDRFHFIKKFNQVFWYNKTTLKKNLLIFKELNLLKQVALLQKYIQNKRLNLVLKLAKLIEKDVQSSTKFRSKYKEIRSFLRMFEKNKLAIFNAFKYQNIDMGWSESYINHYIKTPLSKRFSLFSLDRLKEFLISKNDQFNVYWYV
ncbi:Mbov_0401 family ICE element transposase-like protein [Mycoplasma sp. 4423]